MHPIKSFLQIMVSFQPDFHKKAECAKYDPDLWFSVRTDKKSFTKARDICAICPVLDECKEWILDFEAKNGSVPGLYAGMVEWERLNIRRCSYPGCKKKALRKNSAPNSRSSKYCSPEHAKQAYKEYQSHYQRTINNPQYEYHKMGRIHG